MRQRSETDAIRDVLEQLRTRFPEIPAEVVEACVRTEHQALDGPIRDFIPLLVQKHAGRRLATLALTA
ncbi:MAG: hypothetical protein M9891_11750 [Austwickia sp.]|nr:hypothetical protein [Actinomycetota bacterium]MCO5309944.1 hypothetical protein [Austwickia sp.]